MNIEAGCRAIVVCSGPANGAIVSVIKYVGSKPEITLPDGEYWQVNVWVTYRDSSGNSFLCDSIREAQLKRIDDDIHKPGSWESLQDIFIPDRNVVY